jgi:hypothetical protein
MLEGHMTDIAAFAQISPATLADLLGREQVMDIGMRPLWSPMPPVAVPAFTSVPSRSGTASRPSTSTGSYATSPRYASWDSPRAQQTLLDARARLAREAGETLDDWAEAHRARIDTILGEHEVRD